MNLTIADIEQRTTPILKRYPAIEAAYLFGSLAKGSAGTDSDLDLALVGSREQLAEQKLDILADLTADGFEKIDFVLLDGADTILRFEAVSPNCLLYARDDFDHGSYFSKTLREYFDFEPYLRIQREAIKARLLDGQT